MTRFRLRGAPARRQTEQRPGDTDRYGFEYLSTEDVYLDSACQSLRPTPVLEAMDAYYRTSNACGGRVTYAWGRQVDLQVEQTRRAVLRMLRLPVHRYATSFTLNTTYGINLLLQQLPSGRYRSVITSCTEHNSVFLATMSFARRAAVPRVVLDREPDGSLRTDGVDLRDALIVVSAMNNADGTSTPGLGELLADARRVGATVVVDAAQAMAHAPRALRDLQADAYCFSAHKVYGASLGVVVATHELLQNLDVSFLGGGQVARVERDGYELLPESHTRLEPGLQPWAEIIALGAALDWLDGFETATGESLEQRERRLSASLVEGLDALPNLRLLGPSGTALVTVRPDRVDGHRLAAFLSRSGVMARSGYFCAHHWLLEREGHPPLVRFSLGAHNTTGDVERTLDVMGRLMKGL